MAEIIVDDWIFLSGFFSNGFLARFLGGKSPTNGLWTTFVRLVKHGRARGTVECDGCRGGAPAPCGCARFAHSHSRLFTPSFFNVRKRQPYTTPHRPTRLSRRQKACKQGAHPRCCAGCAPVVARKGWCPCRRVHIPYTHRTQRSTGGVLPSENKVQTEKQKNRET